MKIYTEQSLRDFQFWSGAIDNANELTYEQLDQLEFMLEDLYPDGVDETTINDLMWFEFDTIKEWLGIEDEIEEDEEDEEYIEGLRGIGGFDVVELMPRYDHAQSFYGKALLLDEGKGVITLLSYRTPVAKYNKRTHILTVEGYYSATTARHIREWARQLGIELPRGTKITGKYKA